MNIFTLLTRVDTRRCVVVIVISSSRLIKALNEASWTEALSKRRQCWKPVRQCLNNIQQIHCSIHPPHPPPQPSCRKWRWLQHFTAVFLISMLNFLPSLFHILAFLTMSLPLSPNDSLALGVCSFHWVLISFAVGEVCDDPQGSYSSFWRACCREYSLDLYL